MKNLILLLSLILASICSGQTISTYGETFNNSFGESVFLDLSSFNTGNETDARGLTFARTDLSVFTFNTQVGDGFSTFLTGYDGTVVFNTVAGTTPATGSGIGGQVIAPGFYYFSNPGSDGDSTTGRWIPIGSAANNVVKTREVIKTIDAGALTATVDLTAGDAGSQGMAGVTVTEFLGAKIYNTVGGQLQMIATSSYVDGTEKILTTGNGFIAQVLPAGTYKFVIEYK